MASNNRFLGLEIDSKRIFGLDLLRALAIIFVLIEHGNTLLSNPISRYLLIDGVSVFFVLSGYLIGKILIKTILKNNGLNHTDLIYFWKRRWMRTLPAYYVVLILLLISNTFLNIHTWTFDEWKYLFFLQNFRTSHPPFFPEAWSLSVEEWFYLIIPILLLCITSISKNYKKKYFILIPILFVIFSSLIFRIAYSYDAPSGLIDWDSDIRKVVIMRLDSIGIGVFLAWIHIFYPKTWLKYANWMMAISIIGLVLFKFSEYIAYFHSSFMQVTVLTAFSIPFLTTYTQEKGRYAVIFSYISLISYSLYLVHFTLVRTIILAYLPWDKLGIGYNNFEIGIYMMFWIISFILAHFLYKWVEKPFIDMRNS